MRAILVAAVVAVLCLSHSARAEEKIGPNDVAEAVAADVAPVEVPAVEAESTDPGGITIQLPFYWNDLVDAGVSLLGIAWKALLSVGGAWILAKLVGKERARQVQDALDVSVDFAWDDMGRELKHKLQPGEKLDADARQKLRNKATGHILSILKGAAKKLFESYTVSTVNAKLAAAVQKRKAIASVGK